MEVSGIIKFIDETKTYGESGFRKRELVVTTEEQYPQHILIEFIQDNVTLLDSFQLGQRVKVSINLRGREWTNPSGETRYFNSLVGWKIVSMDEANTNATPTPPMPPSENTSAPTTGNASENKEEEDDLPF